MMSRFLQRFQISSKKSLAGLASRLVVAPGAECMVPSVTTHQIAEVMFPNAALIPRVRRDAMNTDAAWAQ